MPWFEIPSERARILYQETRSVRKLPVNFCEADIDLFGHEFDVRIPATRLLELNQANISPNGIIFKGGRVLAESFNYRHEFIRWANSRKLIRFFVRNYAFRKKQRLDGEGFWIIDNWENAYFHWLLDALPRLYTVRGQLTGSTLLLLESFRTAPYILPSLAPFGIGSIRFIGHNEVLRCRKLLVPSHTAPSGNYNEEIVRGLRQLYSDYYGWISGDSPDKLYISRRNATKRKIINESEVIEAVREHGFTVVCLEDYRFEDQVNMMFNARQVVSNHGAGLANMLFLPEKSCVLELRKFRDNHCNCYFALASALNLKYYYQLCHAANPTEDVGTANIYVDLEQFRKNLGIMLASAETGAAAMREQIDLNGIR